MTNDKSKTEVANESARQWVQGWKVAGPVMQQMRDERLRRMNETEGAKILGAGQDSRATSPEANGLAIWQSWMMRLRLQELTTTAQTRRS